MKRFLPYPFLSMALLVMWLLLAGSVAPRSLVFASLLALFLPLTLKALTPPPVRIRNPRAILRLTGIVLQDILRSNIAVATIITGRRRSERISGFIHIPLDMRNHYGLSVLAIILTCTPGTLWVEYDSVRGRLLLHVLDLVDESAWVRLIKDRYERLLMEIFT